MRNIQQILLNALSNFCWMRNIQQILLNALSKICLMWCTKRNTLNGCFTSNTTVTYRCEENNCWDGGATSHRYQQEQNNRQSLTEQAAVTNEQWPWWPLPWPWRPLWWRLSLRSISWALEWVWQAPQTGKIWRKRQMWRSLLLTSGHPRQFAKEFGWIFRQLRTPAFVSVQEILLCISLWLWDISKHTPRMLSYVDSLGSTPEKPSGSGKKYLSTKWLDSYKPGR